MNSFESDINTFLVQGTFTNNLDEVGNVNLFTEPVDANQRYVAVSLLNYIYDNEKIISLYDVTINEFSVPTAITASAGETTNQDTITQLTSENLSLKDQLNAVLIASAANSTNAEVAAAKNVIINLRIQLGEGKLESDFSDVFPYIKK
jgi:hypothetical protein